MKRKQNRTIFTRHHRQRYPLLIVALSALSLNACGGGESTPLVAVNELEVGTDDSDTTTTETTTTDTTTTDTTTTDSTITDSTITDSESDETTTDIDNTSTVSETDETTTDSDSYPAGLDTSLFKSGSIESIDTVECELSDGTMGECYQIVTVGDALDNPIGPFCPTSLNTTDADAGVWIDGTNFYEANGSFIADLPNIYGNGNDNAQWDLFEEDGLTVRVTTTLEGCENAAQPNIPAEWQSYCVQCAMDDVNVSDGGDRSVTFLIPVTPTDAAQAVTLQNSAGIALTGFQIAARAPVEDIFIGLHSRRV